MSWLYLKLVKLVSNSANMEIMSSYSNFRLCKPTCTEPLSLTSKLCQSDAKWDKSGTFSDQISEHFGAPQILGANLTHFGA